MRNNKLVAISILSLSTLLSTSSFAAKKNAPLTPYQIENINRTNSISIYPLGLMVGRFGADYAFEVSDHVALKFGAGGLYSWAGKDNSILNIGPNFGARFFLSDTAFNSGWYVEPTIGFNYASVKSPDFGAADGWKFGAQAVGGYAWYWDSGFTMSLAAGLDYSAYSGNIQALGVNQLGAWALVPHPTVDFSLGYSW